MDREEISYKKQTGRSGQILYNCLILTKTDGLFFRKREYMDNKLRVLSILYQLLTGTHISVKDIADQYEVSERTIRRDFEMVAQFLSENKELVGDLELIARRGVYYLNHVILLQPNELLLIIKVLIGSRVMNKEKLKELVDKLVSGSTYRDREFLKNLFKNELEYYRSAGNDMNADVLSQVWNLEEIIQRGNVIRICYERLDNEMVDREVYPVSVVFSEHYFYLLACRADKDDSMVIYYRLDRIKSMTELDQKVPLGINTRYQLGDAKLYNQNMFMGKRIRIRFVYTGPSVEAILDKFPTAEIVRRDEGEVELTAMVEYSRGTIMELLSQGSWIRVLGPKKVLEDVQEELRIMKSYYT